MVHCHRPLLVPSFKRSVMREADMIAERDGSQAEYKVVPLLKTRAVI